MLCYKHGLEVHMIATTPFQRLSFYAGLFLVTAATLMLQILETRIYSVISWYHLAFFVISIAMFGLTAGAVWVYRQGAAIHPGNLGYYLTGASLLFAVTTVLSLAIQFTIATAPQITLTGVMVWGELAIIMALPFFFSGVVVSLALTRSPYPVGRVYGVDLVGAAVGCLGVMLVLNVVDGSTAVLWVAVGIALAALAFASSGLGSVAPQGAPGTRLLRWRALVMLALLGLAVVNGATNRGLRPLVVKGGIENLDNIAYEGWNSFSRIIADTSQVDFPKMWGPSSKLPPDTQVEQRNLNIDGAAGTVMYRFDGDLQQVAFLKYDVTNLAYFLPDRHKGAVIGVGGGRDILSARLFGVTDVTGVEINPIFIKLLTESSGFADYNRLADLDGVHFVVDEARSWFARTDQAFDIVQMSLIDTWAATGAGAYTLSENGLYTVEAWKIFLSRLTSSGVFTVSRWYALNNVNETGRMISLAIASLQDLGISEPRRHIFVAANGPVATLVLSRSPLSTAALDRLHSAVDDYGYEILLSPDRSTPHLILASLVAVPDRQALMAFADSFELDLSPPTDARPFFFNQLRFANVPNLLRKGAIQDEIQRGGVVSGNVLASLTLLMIVVISAVLVAATIVLPLRGAIRNAGPAVALGGTAYFLLIGIGFMMTEIGLLQRFSVFLGHPVYSLSIVLFSLILSTGLGSLASDHLPIDGRVKLAVWAVLVAAYLALLPTWLPTVLAEMESAGLLIRAGLCVATLLPAGFLMGFGFPTGMRLVTRVDSRPTPWFWGINGAAGVLAATLAVFVSIDISIDATLRLGALCYLLLIPAALVIGLHRHETVPDLHDSAMGNVEPWDQTPRDATDGPTLPAGEWVGQGREPPRTV
jgi:hypothetical protein